MTSREIEIAKGILDVLHDMDGAQAGEIALHAEVNLRAQCSATEFSASLLICDRNKWITGIKAKVSGKMKWSINDAGEAARLDF